jgi:hypothetical protein
MLLKMDRGQRGNKERHEITDKVTRDVVGRRSVRREKRLPGSLAPSLDFDP